ncbi:hypothetical protein HDU93_008224, partial [Gonapodya sp. JEL0774]
SIDPSSSVNSLKDAIKEELSPELSDVDAYQLDLWKVDIPYEARASIAEDTLKEEDVMKPFKKVIFYFPDQGTEKHIHVIVRRPEGASQKRPGDIDLNDFANKIVKRLREENEEKALSYQASAVSSALMQNALQHLKLLVHPAFNLPNSNSLRASRIYSSCGSPSSVRLQIEAALGDYLDHPFEYDDTKRMRVLTYMLRDALPSHEREPLNVLAQTGTIGLNWTDSPSCMFS